MSLICYLAMLYMLFKSMFLFLSWNTRVFFYNSVNLHTGWEPLRVYAKRAGNKWSVGQYRSLHLCKLRLRATIRIFGECLKTLSFSMYISRIKLQKTPSFKSNTVHVHTITIWQMWAYILSPHFTMDTS